MTIYENTFNNAYQIVETPLSEQFDQFELYPHPLQQRSPADAVQRRMLFILGFVAILAVTAVLYVPRLIHIESKGEEVVVETAVNPAADQTELAGAASGASSGAAAASAITGGISPIFSPQVQHWATQIVSWAKPFGLDPDIVATIMQIESCGDPQAVSGAGAQGLFQVMPFHFVAGENMQDPDTNAMRGMTFYNEQLRYTGGDIYLSFAGYNGGYAASGSSYSQWVNETQRYFTWAKGIYEDAQSGATESETLQQWMQAGGSSLCQQASSRLGLQ